MHINILKFNTDINQAIGRRKAECPDSFFTDAVEKEGYALLYEYSSSCGQWQSEYPQTATTRASVIASFSRLLRFLNTRPRQD